MSVSTCDPLQLDNLATCFRCYNADALAIKTYLLCQTLSIATPPCVTPSAPTSTGFKSKTDTTIRISWFQPANSGSLITSYTIKWGTVTGVYTNSATVGISPKLYTITGLTQGTQYFWVIQANSFSGCSSANSAESNTTTNGAPPTNGLLNSLTSYWKFDVLNSAVDSVSTNDLTLNVAATCGVQAGIINTALGIGPGGSYAEHASNADFSMGLGVSFTFSGWIFSTDFAPDALTHWFLNKFNDANIALCDYWTSVGSGNGIPRFAVRDTGGNIVGCGTLVAVNNTWNHIVFGFDAVAQRIFLYLNNGAVSTTPTVTDGVQSSATSFRIGEPNNGAYNALALMAMDELGFWKNRVLSATDVANLYNGGAGLPLSSFTA